MEGDNLNTLQQSLFSGINIFAGAGFSVLAKDKHKRNLPTGAGLVKELQEKFKYTTADLVRLSTILEKTRKDEFYRFLHERFTVEEFAPVYQVLNRIKIRNIYTTNIDDLFPKIFKQNKNKYLHDQQRSGVDNSPNAINYLPLHGNVDAPDSKYIFSSTNLANIYNNANRIWNYLSQAIETYPTLFIGYSLSDPSTIQALTSQNTFSNAHKDKWIVIRESEKSEAEYYQALGFNILVSDTKEVLEWMDTTLSKAIEDTTPMVNKTIEELFPANLVPKDKYKLDIQRPINDFFQGQPPIWSDIVGNTLYKTSYFKRLQDSIYDSSKQTILIGAPATGKTTVAMQVAFSINFRGEKLIFDNLTETKVDYIVKIADNKKLLLFIENFTDNASAFMKLCEVSNFKVVGIDRGHNYGVVSHLFEGPRYDIINVTELSDMDIQGIFDSLPADLKGKTIKRENNNKYQDDSIFEFVLRNINQPSIKQRYYDVLKDLDVRNPDLAEFLVLCAYAHSSRIPLSLEMACSYFSDDYHYEGVLEMRNQLGDLVKDYSRELIDDDSMDYYYPRSYFIAESIIDGCPPKLLQRVMENVIIMIPPVQICHYDVFRKNAFDKNIVLKAFRNWKEGKQFYEDVYLYDYENPYILQQGALYLSAKSKYTDASEWIDRAMTKTNNKHFSIRNSHAIILFDANINSDNAMARSILEKSMLILEDCFNNDKRKVFHAVRYASQAISFYKKYGDEKSIAFLRKSKEWLLREHDANSWNKEIRRLLNDLHELHCLD